MVRHPEVVIDLCTGSGALALALKHQFPSASVYATDISPEALEVAHENKDRAGLEVYIAEGDLFDPLPAALIGEVDLIVVNPPYVALSEYQKLPLDVQREPEIALVSGPSGLEIIERIGASVAEWLRPGGVVVCEIGENQGVSASSSFADLPAVVRKDLAGRDRYVVAVKPLMDAAVAAIRSGKVVGVPTDTVYGLAVDPLKRECGPRPFCSQGPPRAQADWSFGSEP